MFIKTPKTKRDNFIPLSITYDSTKYSVEYQKNYLH